MKPTTLIVDDNALFLEWARNCLRDVSDVITCVREKEVLTQFRSSRIDVLIADITLANNENGIEIVSSLKEFYDFSLIFISGNHYSVFENTLSLSPDANLTKPVTEFQLLTTFNTVWKKQLKSPRQLNADLTPREEEILLMLCKGKSSSEITEFLSISVHTVQRVRKNLLKKFDVHSIQDLLSKAYSMGYLRSK